ncbi:hypothetical protein DACRYDRAFT_106868 [Dacryopinax primogenitus]|uniref:Uncharacterized protein n=1 Tax=Dacryopinax primogenitus (strain DJM 731) TaxID=1858805 RepID=M5FXQ7_DACPD|nr:uncharacterized protein DACRYDRAFT_106868 [Dacryopinax primogenitus]EJU02816.1 hypothetical protein DACRYDRAFT_106868 [Dacryopinax primogenitus]
MSVIFTGIIGCQSWHPSVAGSHSWTCTAAILLPAHAAVPLMITEEELQGVLCYFPPPGAAVPPEEGVYFASAKMASATPALVMGEDIQGLEVEYELDTLVLLPQAFKQFEVALTITVIGCPCNIVNQMFDLKAQPYIFNGKQVACFGCYFSEEGHFARKVPTINQTALLSITGLLMGTALPQEGSPEGQLSL